MKDVPKCVGIIMDGNRRWGKDAGIDLARTHKAGYEKLKEVLVWAGDFGIETVIAYAFSTENWARPKEEVQKLMKLLTFVLKNELQFLLDNDTKLKIVGERDVFAPEIQELMKQMEEATDHCKSHTLALGLSYGGRSEILSAAKKLAKTEDPQKATEEDMSKLLWTEGLPEPDMMIRTGGQRRLSNFLPWQSTYSELFFTDTYWPALTREELESMLEEYGHRKRNFGI